MTDHPAEGHRIGVDSGGTFTDVCLLDLATGELSITKVASTPDDPARAVVAGVREVLNGWGGAGVRSFGHGTTVATNTLLEQRGAETGLITTDGFGDLLELGRQRRPDLYDLQADKPTPPVRRSRRLEVRERVRYDGAIEVPLDEEEVRRVAQQLREMEVEAVAICFLYSFVRPEHEQTVRRILEEELPGAFISTSSEVAPEFREYERLSTVVINAYLGPTMHRYLGQLGPRVAELGITAPLHITQSNGGVISFAEAADLPVRTILSGPSTGLIGAAAIGEAAGFDRLITFDMGGTSTDVALIDEGRPRFAVEGEVAGYPIKCPMLDINTVGAGGGSIAWIDSGGHLKVGPRSGGAVPGPVCYGLGGREPTVTDANVVLQTLNPTHLLGGRMAIDRDAALVAIRGLADRLGMETMATAEGMLRVVAANMARAIRVISVQRGHDPRDYMLVAFGGAGPLHAARLAQELDIPRVLIPPTPGVLCALGLLVTDLRTDFSLTRQLPTEERALEAARDGFARLEAQATGWFDREGIAAGDRRLRRSADMRYAGQNYELSVELPDGDLDSAALSALRERFHRLHERRYGYAAEEEPVQLITLRAEASARTGSPLPAAEAESGGDPSGARIGERPVFLPESTGFTTCPVYDRARFRPGDHLVGPAVVEQMDSTTVVLPRQSARVDGHRNLILEERG